MIGYFVKSFISYSFLSTTVLVYKDCRSASVCFRSRVADMPVLKIRQGVIDSLAARILCNPKRRVTGRDRFYPLAHQIFNFAQALDQSATDYGKVAAGIAQFWQNAGTNL